MSEQVVVVAGAGVADDIGLAALYGGADSIQNNVNYGKILSASEYGNYLPEFWEYCGNLAKQIGKLKPSIFHKVVADNGFTVITQNIGGMHRQAGSENVIELNGNVFTARCMRCGTVFDFPMDSYKKLAKGEVPNCASCGKDRVRPNIVLPNERKMHRRQIEKVLQSANAVVYVGVIPDAVSDTVETWYHKVPHTLLVAEEPWGNFNSFIKATPSEWAADGAPVHSAA